MLSISRHKTAIKRPDMSKPIRLALEHGLLNHETTLFDYGCGYGGDIDRLNEQGIVSAGWDPVYRPEQERKSADVVNLGYVVNVIEDVNERAAVLREAWSLASKLLIVSARLSIEANNKPSQNRFADGYVTSRGTFQKLYDQQELRDWINQILGVSCVVVAPGIFYIFRDQSIQQSFVVSRFRRNVTVPRALEPHKVFEKHKELFESLMAFVGERGRLPTESESPIVGVIRREFGSLNRAYALMRRVTGSEQWDRICEQRSQDLLIYLALSQFGGRPHFSELPESTRQDVKAFYTTYNRACQAADELLFSAGRRDAIQQACRTSTVGKLTADALYIHRSALPYLPLVLRMYEGCARTYIGAVDGANIVKLHRLKPQISYLQYPDFDKDPHPALAASLKVPLNTFHIDYREYRDTRNPFILHRKETMLGPDHPLRQRFARLTEQEERYGLYEHPERIGTRDGWQRMLDEKGVYLAGHKLMRRKQTTDGNPKPCVSLDSNDPQRNDIA